MPPRKVRKPGSLSSIRKLTFSCPTHKQIGNNSPGAHPWPAGDIGIRAGGPTRIGKIGFAKKREQRFPEMGTFNFSVEIISSTVYPKSRKSPFPQMSQSPRNRFFRLDVGRPGGQSGRARGGHRRGIFGSQIPFIPRTTPIFAESGSRYFLVTRCTSSGVTAAIRAGYFSISRNPRPSTSASASASARAPLVW